MYYFCFAQTNSIDHSDQKKHALGNEKEKGIFLIAPHFWVLERLFLPQRIHPLENAGQPKESSPVEGALQYANMSDLSEEF